LSSFFKNILVITLDNLFRDGQLSPFPPLLKLYRPVRLRHTFGFRLLSSALSMLALIRARIRAICRDEQAGALHGQVTDTE
jgi:hypothetical protein